MTPGERIKEMRETLGLTQGQLGDMLGFKWTKIKDIEIGKQKLTPEIALAIEKKFSFNFRWLLIGDGGMNVEQTKFPGHSEGGPIQYPLDNQHGVLHQQLQRILDAGNMTNIEAIKSMLTAFDPALKKDGSANEDEKARMAGDNAA